MYFKEPSEEDLSPINKNLPDFNSSFSSFTSQQQHCELSQHTSSHNPRTVTFREQHHSPDQSKYLDSWSSDGYISDDSSTSHRCIRDDDSDVEFILRLSTEDENHFEGFGESLGWGENTEDEEGSVRDRDEWTSPRDFQSVDRNLGIMQREFGKMRLENKIFGLLKKIGLDSPSFIQTQFLKHLRAGVSVALCSPPVSGKTSAIALAAIEASHRIKSNVDWEHPIRIVVLSPCNSGALTLWELLATFDCQSLLCLDDADFNEEQDNLTQNTSSILVSTVSKFLLLAQGSYIMPEKLEIILIDDAQAVIQQHGMDLIRLYLFEHRDKFSNDFQWGLLGYVFEGLELLIALLLKMNKEEIWKQLKKCEEEKLPWFIELRHCIVHIKNNERKLGRLMEIVNTITLNDWGGCILVFCETHFNISEVMCELAKSYGNDTVFGISNSLDKEMHYLLGKQKEWILVTSEEFVLGMNLPYVSAVINYDPVWEATEYQYRQTRCTCNSGKVVTIVSSDIEFDRMQLISKTLGIDLEEEK